MSERIGIFGGSFDPVHNGHLILARQAREELQLDRVLLIPAALSPHKTTNPPAPPELRLQLLRLAVEGEAGLEVEDLELRRNELPSYSIDTVRELRQRHPVAQWFYLIGSDNLAELHTWKDIEELRRLVQFVVLTRDENEETLGLPKVSRRIDISSTEIRNRVARGQSIRYFLPDKACSYLLQHNPYLPSVEDGSDYGSD